MSPPNDAVVSTATARALELPSLLAVLGELAATDVGRERLLALAPIADLAALTRARKRYEEAVELVAERRLVGAFDAAIGELLAQLRSGRPAAAGLALVRLADLLRATSEARERLLATGGTDDGAAGAHFPELGSLARALPDLSALARSIGKTLDRRGEVREDASPKLTGLRERIRTVRDSLYGELKQHLETEREHLSEETIPLRGGRLVLVLASGARGKVPGLVHGRSATGKSFYFEPLAVVESNNNLQQAVEDEEAERARILEALLSAARRALPDLEVHAAFLAELDSLQAAVRFAALAGGGLAELAPRHELELVGARHPLLDPAYAELRQRALGAAGHEGAVVPLSVSLSPERRALVVTGPNAGGKTVVLKTLGLLALASQCGLPVPASAGTRIPRLTRVVATVGDEQDLLADRSTFSGRLLRLKEAWEGAGEDSLILLDELGSGTDPEEGAALSIALLEGLLEKRSLTLITTHLTPLAAAALELPGASCAAMEFEPASGAPTYRLLPGPPGGSEALALARRLGLPRAWLARAEERLGSGHRDLRRLLAELERVRGELSAEREALAAERAASELSRARLEREQQELAAERKAVGRRLKAELDAFRGETRRRLREEVARLKAELDAGRKRGLEPAAEERLFAAAPVLEVEEEAAELPPRLGGPVRHRALGWTGTLEKVAEGKAEVLVRGKRVRARLEELAGVASPAAREGRDGVSLRSGPQRRGSQRAGAGTDAEVEPSPELHLIGQRVEPALEELDAFLDQALLGARREVRVVHGHGSGRLRDAVRQHLRFHPAVATQRPGAPNEGGNGATVVTLRGAE